MCKVNWLFCNLLKIWIRGNDLFINTPHPPSLWLFRMIRSLSWKGSCRISVSVCPLRGRRSRALIRRGSSVSPRSPHCSSSYRYRTPLRPPAYRAHYSPGIHQGVVFTDLVLVLYLLVMHFYVCLFILFYFSLMLPDWGFRIPILLISISACRLCSFFNSSQSIIHVSLLFPLFIYFFFCPLFFSCFFFFSFLFSPPGSLCRSLSNGSGGWFLINSVWMTSWSRCSRTAYTVRSFMLMS